VNWVSIVIPTWKRAAWLKRCLAAVHGQEPPSNEVIVVGRAEDEAAQAVVSRAAAQAGSVTRWITVDRSGHIAPLRRGIEMAKSDIVAFLDDDTEPLAGWLAALIEPFSDSRVACVGGRVATPGFKGRIRRDAGRIRWYGQHVGNVGAREAPGVVQVDGVMECNWAWRRAVLSRLHFDSILDFDDASMFGLDLSLQALALGYRVVYQPAARVLHHAAPRSPELDRHDRPRRAFCYSRNYTYIALKHFSTPRRAMFLAWWWLIGEDGAYGLARAMKGLVRRRNGTGAEIRAAWAGKAEGWRQWRDGR
jgi:GT2 family glycosyltransferase